MRARRRPTGALVYERDTILATCCFGARLESLASASRRLTAAKITMRRRAAPTANWFDRESQLVVHFGWCAELQISEKASQDSILITGSTTARFLWHLKAQNSLKSAYAALSGSLRNVLRLVQYSGGSILPDCSHFCTLLPRHCTCLCADPLPPRSNRPWV
jgi:hypothetical protein